MVVLLIGLSEVFHLLPFTSSVTPWLLPVFLVLVTVRQEEGEIQILAMLGGVLWEIFNGLPIGSFSLPLLLAYRLWHWFYHSVSFYNFNWKQFPILVSITWGIVYGWLLMYTFALSRITSVTVPSFELLLHKAPKSFLVTLLFSPLVYAVYIVFERLTDYIAALNRRV